jgi:hypothetical protein
MWRFESSHAHFDSLSHRVSLHRFLNNVYSSPSNTFNFTTCQRPDGSTYGTSGTCRKGSEVETRRQQSVAHLENSIRLLNEKKSRLSSPEAKGRIDRLVSKLEADKRAISGEKSNVKITGFEWKAPKPQPRSQTVSHESKTPQESKNKDNGFYGTTLSRVGNPEEVQLRWNAAARAVQSRGPTPVQAQRILDSTWGRHFADQLSSMPTSQVSQYSKALLDSMNLRDRRTFQEVWKYAQIDDLWD